MKDTIILHIDERFTVKEAVTLAYKNINKHRTLLRTNEGMVRQHTIDCQASFTLQIYLSEKNEHAEIEFTTKEKFPGRITALWITNSPCAECSEKLITFFKNKVEKPTLYIGKIYKGDWDANRKKLIELVKNGFNIEVWEELNQLLFPDNGITTKNKKFPKTAKDYIDEIKKEANNPRPKDEH